MTSVAIEPARCRSCGTELAPSLLACPACRSLVHAPSLTALAERARRHEDAGRTDEAIDAWREALALLPADAGQHVAITARIDELSTRPATPTPASRTPTQHVVRSTHDVEPRPSTRSIAKVTAVLAAVLTFGLTKGKLLLVSLPKMSGMILGLGASLGIYWAAWGWQFAVGVIASIYVHELGHVFAMRMHGIPSSAPMFVPGLGAYVRMHRLPKSEVEHARIGLAGPIAGLGAAIACTILFFATGNALFAALAKFGAFINLINLVPVWHLDGARAFGAFAKRDRWIAIAACIGGAALASNAFPLVVGLISLVRLGAPDPGQRDGSSLAMFVVVVLALSALLTLPIPGFTPG